MRSVPQSRICAFAPRDDAGSNFTDQNFKAGGQIKFRPVKIRAPCVERAKSGLKFPDIVRRRSNSPELTNVPRGRADLGRIWCRSRVDVAEAGGRWRRPEEGGGGRWRGRRAAESGGCGRDRRRVAEDGAGRWRGAEAGGSWRLAEGDARRWAGPTRCLLSRAVDRSAVQRTGPSSQSPTPGRISRVVLGSIRGGLGVDPRSGWGRSGVDAGMRSGIVLAWSWGRSGIDVGSASSRFTHPTSQPPTTWHDPSVSRRDMRRAPHQRMCDEPSPATRCAPASEIADGACKAEHCGL